MPPSLPKQRSKQSTFHGTRSAVFSKRLRYSSIAKRAARPSASRHLRVTFALASRVEEIMTRRIIVVRSLVIKACLGIAAVCLLFATPLIAQNTNIGSLSGVNIGGATCPTPQQQTQAPLQASTSVSCATVTATAEAISSVSHTDSHTFASLGGIIGGSSPTFSFGESNASTSAYDVLHVAGTSPMFFRFYYTTNGTLAGTATSVVIPNGGGSYYASQSTAAAEFAFQTSSSDGIHATNDVASYELETLSTLVGSTQSVEASVTTGIHGDVFGGYVDIPYFGGGSLNFASIFAATAIIESSGSSAVGSATVDFSHTFHLTGVDALDANGNSVLGQDQLTFDSGTPYYLGDPTLTTAPEPSASLLLATGLAAFGPLIKVMRRLSNAIAADVA